MAREGLIIVTAKNLSEADRELWLSFDEMALRETYVYDTKTKKVLQPANKLQCVMVTLLEVEFPEIPIDILKLFNKTRFFIRLKKLNGDLKVYNKKYKKRYKNFVSKFLFFFIINIWYKHEIFYKMLKNVMYDMSSQSAR